MNPAPPSIATKLTIILTLKDRPEFTRRWMNYMNEHHCQYKILIADGGADKAIEDQLRDSSNYPNLDYEYIRYPFDENVRVFYSKQLDVCGRVKTEYLLWADNDDFFLLDKIPLIIDFLEGHPDYSGCRGTYAQFTLYSKDGEMTGEPLGENYTVEPSEVWSIENENFMERMEDFFKMVDRYYLWLNWYCVFRADKVLKSLEILYKYNFSEVVLNELLLNLLLLREGKIKVIDKLYYARQLGTSQGSANVNAENNVLESFLVNDAFHNFNNFILKEHFVEEEGERILILKALAYYFGIYCSHYYYPEPVVKELPLDENLEIEFTVEENLVKGPQLEENLIQKGKGIIKQNEKLYFLARKAVQPFRALRKYLNVRKNRESQLSIAHRAIESLHDNGIPTIESQPGIRIPIIEQYILRNL